MRFLLPHSYKNIGAIIAPLGFIIWFCMQRGIITKLLIESFGEENNATDIPLYHIINVIVAVISFFSFLAGLYFVTFSKEKIEDEMVQRTRLDSFQFAALTQMFFIIIGFILMALFNIFDDDDASLALFFLFLLLTFWLSFIGRFNYVLHIKMKQ